LGEGADGFAFVLQNNGPGALAGRGSAGGFAFGDGSRNRNSPGIPNSIAVFFDTFKNDDGRDPSDNYIAICTHGKIRDMRWPPSRLGIARKLPLRLKDGRPHDVRIVFKPPVMSVYLDDPEQPVLTAAVDLSPVVSRDGAAYVGFTASTGGGFENHDILSWSLRPDVSSDMSVVTSKISFMLAPCLEGRNLCTPERAIVEQTGPDEYHVVLPAHLEWGASVPNPGGREIAISNATGMVCWDLEARGSEGCSGPAGAVINRNRGGRTQFSVKDRSGAFADNQGYFEFDVRLK